MNAEIEYLEKLFQSQTDSVREMFKAQSNNILSLSDATNKLGRELSETKGELAGFRSEVIRHFDSCPVDDLREHTGRIDVELERLRATRTKTKSDDKISRPPEAQGGMLITWTDWKVILKSLPFVGAVIGTIFGLQYCQTDTHVMKALVQQKAQVISNDTEAEKDKKD